MKKYNIEGGIDFFTELYKSLESDENTESINNDNYCLISSEPLIDKFITMSCGHKFNYVPLFNDLVNHKKKFNLFETHIGRSNNNEIRCPYCRKKQEGLLPYYEDLPLPKIVGVNMTVSNQILCEFIQPNPNYDPSGNNPVEKDAHNNGNCKFFQCFLIGKKISNLTSELDYITYMKDKNYCYQHTKQMYKQYKKEKLDKIKEEDKNKKLKEKEDIKKAKEEEKQKQKEEKQKAKAELKKLVMMSKMSKSIEDIKIKSENNENIIIQENIVIQGNTLNNTGCITLLKSGPRNRPSVVVKFMRIIYVKDIGI